MLASEKFDALQQLGQSTTAEALELFDQLDPVDSAFMMGRWQGSGFHTGHPMDGLLEVANWYGKEFVNPDCVHPLLFLDNSGNIFKMAPNPVFVNLALRLPMPRNNFLKPLYTFLNTLQKTENSKARLRMLEFRQKLSAAMIYDEVPICDVFRKVSENTVLGLMDYKASDRPFFFVLRREMP